MDALSTASKMAQELSLELGFVRGMGLAMALARREGNHALADKLFRLSLESELARLDLDERIAKAEAA